MNPSRQPACRSAISTLEPAPSNVIPGALEVAFNLRYNPHWSAPRLESEIVALLDQHGLDYTLHWHRSGEPFYTPEGKLRRIAREVLERFPARLRKKARVVARPMRVLLRHWARNVLRLDRSTPAFTRLMSMCAWPTWRPCQTCTSC